MFKKYLKARITSLATVAARLRKFKKVRYVSTKRKKKEQDYSFIKHKVIVKLEKP